MSDAHHLTQQALTAGFGAVLGSPADDGRLDLIVARPGVDERLEQEVGRLDLRAGLIGDNWGARPSSRSADGGPHPEMQLNVINSRLAALIAPDPDRRVLVGDQLHVDLDLSHENLPVGTRLAIGEAVIEVTAEPHRGCKKFAARFGVEALAFISTPEGRDRRLRGLNAKVVTPGVVRRGDRVHKL